MILYDFCYRKPPCNELYTWKIFLKYRRGGCFKLSVTVTQIFNFGIYLFKCLWVNPYLPILFQSGVLRTVSFDVKVIWGQCCKTFYPFIFVCLLSPLYCPIFLWWGLFVSFVLFSICFLFFCFCFLGVFFWGGVLSILLMMVNFDSLLKSWPFHRKWLKRINLL